MVRRNRYKKNRKNGRSQNNPTSLSTAETISLHPKKASFNIKAGASGTIFLGGSGYSFNSGSSVMYLSLATILSGQEFNTLKSVYKNFRIKSATILAVGTAPYSSSASFPVLYCDFELLASGNPDNTKLINRDTSKWLLPYNNMRVQRRTWKFGSRDPLSQWTDTSVVPVGQFVIGNNPSYNAFSSAQQCFDIMTVLDIEFDAVKI